MLAGSYKRFRKDWNWMEHISSWSILTFLLYQF